MSLLLFFAIWFLIVLIKKNKKLTQNHNELWCLCFNMRILLEYIDKQNNNKACDYSLKEKTISNLNFDKLDFLYGNLEGVIKHGIIQSYQKQLQQFNLFELKESSIKKLEKSNEINTGLFDSAFERLQNLVRRDKSLAAPGNEEYDKLMAILTMVQENKATIIDIKMMQENSNN